MEKLEAEGFVHDPYVERNESCRKIVEVYPHPSMVTIFDMDQILKYKNKSGRDYEFLYEEFRKYQNNLRDLETGDPALETPEIVEKEVEGMIGQSLKAYEDKLDAIFCAYIGYYYRSRPDDCEVLGTEEGGYIMTPIKKEMEEQLREIRGQKELDEF